jgi:hypothetical protein
MSRDLDAYLEEAVLRIRTGSYAELLRQSESLNRVKEKKIAAADKHRKLQIKNINDLFEYEVLDATAQRRFIIDNRAGIHAHPRAFAGWFYK